MEDIFEKLSAPFPPEKVSWRVGNTNINKQTGKPPEGKAASGLALAYLDARDVADRLDEVVGPAGWMCKYSHANGKTVCDLAIKCDSEWVWKADGAGDTDIEAEKGALSDAYKRAGVRWGIGRYLYGLPSPWVELTARGRSWVIAEAEYKKLEDLLTKYSGEIEWGTPAERATLRALCNMAQNCLQTADDVRVFREQNAGSIPLLRVKAREHLNNLLSRIEDGAKAKAA